MTGEIENQVLAEQIVNKAIQEIVFKYNAYAPIISSFRIVYTNLIPTLGVDKYARLAINPDFVVKNQNYMKGIIIHEVLHIFFGHTSDTRSKLAYTDDVEHNKIANIAEDCAINQFVAENLPDEAITPSTLGKMLWGDFHNIYKEIRHGESAEYYYDLITEELAKREKIKIKVEMEGGEIKMKGSGTSNNKEEKKEKNNNGEGEGEGKGEGDKTDEEIKNGMCSTDEMCTEKMQDELDKMGIEHISQEEVNESVLETAKEISKSQGYGYGGLADFAREMLNPKVDWRPLLQATIRNAEKKVWNIHTRSTYKRVSRRSGQILLPKKYGNKISVTLSFDTSGSISQEMVNQFLSEIQSCMRYSEIKECALWHTENYWYGSPEELERRIEKIFESGGTDEACMGNAEQHCKADLHIHFSDGYHGDNFGFKEPHKNIEIIWDGKEIKEIRKEF